MMADSEDPTVNHDGFLQVSGVVFYWRGPAPFHYVRVPDEAAEYIHDLASELTYGWGMIPVAATIGGTRSTTALFPQTGGYLVLLKAAVRQTERIGLDDEVRIELELGGS